MALRIVFMGTPDFSVPTLHALHQAGHEIVACYCQPPRPSGRRGLEKTPSPVHRAAEQLGIEVYTPVSLKSPDEQLRFAELRADVAVVVAYGLLLPTEVLNAPEHGCFNGHASLLPRWRGAAPIQRAIMAGDQQTGIMIMKMDAGLDTGPVAMTDNITIQDDMTASRLHDELSIAGADLMVKAMSALEAGSLQLEQQSPDGVIYANKIAKQETRINWDMPCEVVKNHIMGLSAFPGAWCEMELAGKTQRVKVLSARTADGEGPPGLVLDNGLTVACAVGAIKLLKLQKAGSKAMMVNDFLRGNNVPIATRFS